jgi:Na+-driven multidrug efflux pump
VAIGGLLGTGAASIVSRNLGSGDSEKAYSAAGMLLVLLFVLGYLLP